MEFYSSLKMPDDKVAPPEIIMSNLMEERKKLIMGHYGDPKSNKEKLRRVTSS